jgi:hypothetical protein
MRLMEDIRPEVPIRTASADADHVLDLRKVCKQFGTDPAVDALVDVDLVLRRGEWLSITGPSGSCEGMASRPEANDYRCLFFEWAATNYLGVTYTEADGVHHMTDFVRAHPDTFNPLWTRERARAEEQEWHAELALARADLALAEVVERTGVPFDTVIDYTPLPLHWECGGLSFIALQTGTALQAEGAAMHHCVASYWKDVVDGSRIYSILENGSRVATLELTGRPTQDKKPNDTLTASARGTGQRRRYGRNQLVGPRNSRPAPKVAKAVGTFVEEINKRVAVKTMVGAVD